MCEERKPYKFDISIIIVSWNVAKLILNCIQSIIDFVTDYKYEIIVIDNNSSDTTVPLLQKYYPEINIITNNENIGFAKANNQGLAIAKGQYTLFLNPDTLITKDAIKSLISNISQDIEIGLVGPKLIDQNGRIQSSCARRLPSITRTLFLYSLRFNKLPFIGPYLNRKYLNPYEFDVTQEVEAISGAAMLSTTSILQKIGGFGKDYIHTGEDLDLCYRISKLGFKIKYVSNSIIIHYGGQSAQKSRVNTRINSAISAEYYFRNNLSPLHADLYKFIIRYIDMPITLFISIIYALFVNLNFDLLKENILVIKGIKAWKKV